MELYVHIPFCVKKCHYCDFLSFPGYGCGADERHRSLSLNYINALCKELDGIKEWRAGEQEKANGRITSVFIGGGTPSVLSLNETEMLLKKISDILQESNGSEFTVECNPGTISREKLLLYKKYGVNY